MNSSHVASAGGGTAFGAAFAAAIAGTWHLDIGLITNWLIVASGAGAVLVALVVWWIKWKWPDVPPLPGELVDLADTKPVEVAQVLPRPPASPPASAPAPVPPPQPSPVVVPAPPPPSPASPSSLVDQQGNKI